jgi:protein SCO1/2
MFYASCPNACPMLIADIKRVDAQLDVATRNRTRVLLVSLDPQRDTPATMKDAALRQQVDLARWKLARAEPGREREIAAVLGIRYRPQADGEINHSSVLSVLTRSGVVDLRQEGLQLPPGPIVERLRALSRSNT